MSTLICKHDNGDLADVEFDFAEVTLTALECLDATRAMTDYFKPLMSWLEEQDKGRQIGWE